MHVVICSGIKILHSQMRQLIGRLYKYIGSTLCTDLYIITTFFLVRRKSETCLALEAVLYSNILHCIVTVSLAGRHILPAKEAHICFALPFTLVNGNFYISFTRISICTFVICNSATPSKALLSFSYLYFVLFTIMSWYQLPFDKFNTCKFMWLGLVLVAGNKWKSST